MYIVLSAVLSSFFAVRIIKGHWTRNPQYLAVAMVGSVVGAVVLHAGWPELDGDLLLPTIVSFIGSCVAVFAFDQMIGAD
jgi:uncharacterized membrane protein YeaQ/YmgE (transglycosylase-associated protein family)